MCQSCTEVLRSSVLGFYRLIGCLYFRSGVKNKDFTPLTHFKKTKEQNFDLASSDLQKTWVELIRFKTIEMKDDEKEFIPSLAALHCHWLRSNYALLLWQQATHQYVTMPPLSIYGWIVQEDGSLACGWDSVENFSKVRAKVSFLSKGCSCKSGCKTKICSCLKHSRLCGPGCKCIDCENLSIKPVASKLVIVVRS